MAHRTTEQLDASLADIESSPADNGTLRLIVRRPAELSREVLTEGSLDSSVGLVGDNWSLRPSRETPDNSPHPGKQLNIMNYRAALAVADGDDVAVPLAGDQLFVDLDLSATNLPPGTQLAIGSAVIEVTEFPHNGCAKFTQRFGLDAMRWVNSEVGKHLKLRGICARVVVDGEIAVGNSVTKVESPQ
jgi:hypothetical protein